MFKETSDKLVLLDAVFKFYTSLFQRLQCSLKMCDVEVINPLDTLEVAPSRWYDFFIISTVPPK